MIPNFPEFKTIELEDRETLHSIFTSYQPETSEWTFTNFFMWRHFYRFQWSCYKEWFLFICHPIGEEPYALQPMGPSPRIEPIRILLDFLKEEFHCANPSIKKADSRCVHELNPNEEFEIQPMREHFDYVYSSQDLISLAGRKYHAKKNHLNRFEKTYLHSYQPLSSQWISECLKVLDQWCIVRDCAQHPLLLAETKAVQEVLLHWDRLGLQGGIVFIQDKVSAFSFGELLNPDTAVIHAEKADPGIPELFTVINQRFCQNAWSHVPYINREQDLGEPGLRQSKLSYHPVQLVEKFLIRYKSK